MRANRILVLFLLGSHHSQVFNSIVVFSEGYVEDESGARVPLPPDFLKTGAAAADAFNDLPRTCEKVPVVKRSAEEDNDNERCDCARDFESWLAPVVCVSSRSLKLQSEHAQAPPPRAGGGGRQRGRRLQQQRQRSAYFACRCYVAFQCMCLNIFFTRPFSALPCQP